MSRDWRFFLADMLDACDAILVEMEGLSRERFDAERSRRDILMMNLLILGEAAKKIPEEVRTRFSQVEWRGMAGLRDVIAHSYYRVDPNIIWDVAVTRIPGIRPVLAQIADAYPFEPLDGTPAERDA